MDFTFEQVNMGKSLSAGSGNQKRSGPGRETPVVTF
jgi:hypothetical protein